jgi:hypothetical protein
MKKSITTIRITKELEEYIKHYGKFGETHSDVICRKLLDFDEFKKEAIKGKKDFHRYGDLENPLLEVLLASENHTLKCSEAINEVGKIINFLPLDKKRHNKGEIRWKVNVQWARNSLVREGYIYNPEFAGHGYWKLTEKGIEKAMSIVQIAA